MNKKLCNVTAILFLSNSY